MENYFKLAEEQKKLNEFIIKEIKKRKFIIDSSVVIKWFYEKNEENLEQANFFFNKSKNGYDIIVAPDLLIYEILNFFKTKKEIPDDDVYTILNEINNTVSIYGIGNNLFKKAFKIARANDITIYDSIYISLSEELEIPFITADLKLYEIMKKQNSNIIILRDFIKYY
ncbi:MAG: type II toxin-antitoxin system VapC family toxin [Cyanobacteria bacterium]|nr:type II toxin-antitoxin system VapC family toxin [Cyanobacteriota bacterium]